MSAAIVMVKPWESAGKIHRGTVSAGSAVNFVADLGIDFARPLDIVADEQIELAVIVIIEERRGSAPVAGRAAHPRFGSDFAEFSLAFIVKQMTAAHCGHENVIESVIVI